MVTTRDISIPVNVKKICLCAKDKTTRESEGAAPFILYLCTRWEGK
jgi:hypothetical protein